MYHPSNADSDIQYQYRYAYSGSNLQYMGIAPPDASENDQAWIIKKYSYDGSSNLISIVFADDSKKFNKSWTNRATYTYK